MTITIDGKQCVCEKGEYLLDIAARNDITIPTLCHHGGLPGAGCCRVCITEIEQGGWKSIVTACIYPVERECEVFTGSERVTEQRKMILSMLKARSPESREIAALCEQYEAGDVNRFITQPGEKCVLCGLCVSACASLGTGAIATVNRGVDKAVKTPYDEPSLACVGCKSCAEVCPTGAIKYSEDNTSRTIWGKTLPLKKCAACGAVMGTFFEITRAAEKTGTEAPSLCDKCKQKAMTEVMANTFGR